MENFRFQEPGYLYGLLLVPLLAILLVKVRKSDALKLGRLASSALLQYLVTTVTSRKFRVWVYPACIACLFIALANPQWGSIREKTTVTSSDVMIAIDISNSMLARDIAPDRLEKSKKTALKLIEKLRGNRIGVIVFAGNAYLQMPLTNDYEAAQIFVNSANTDMATSQGTAIGEAIDLADISFNDTSRNMQKALILLSDGEDHDSRAQGAARDAAADGIHIHTIGVGSTQGAPIPFDYQGTERYKQDEQGNTVISKLDDKILRDLASTGHGTYYPVSQSDKAIAAIESDVQNLTKVQSETPVFSEYQSYFQYFILLALCCLAFDKWAYLKAIFNEIKTSGRQRSGFDNAEMTKP